MSGRAGADAAAIVGVPQLTYVGNHGLELEPDAGEWATQLAAFLATVAWPRIENKGLTAALHYRDMDEDTARPLLDTIAERARARGFIARYGRKVLELVPPLEANKGTAVRQLLDERELHRALYAGDDTTDLDAFHALERMEPGIRVAVASAESPPELIERADIVLAAQPDVLGLLRAL